MFRLAGNRFEPFPERTGLPGHTRGISIILLTIKDIFTDQQELRLFFFQNDPFYILTSVRSNIILFISPKTDNIALIPLRCAMCSLRFWMSSFLHI